MSSVLTYHTNISTDKATEEILSLFAQHMSKVSRKYFASVQSGNTKNIKKIFIKRFGINARQFNSIKSDVSDGLIASNLELLKLHIKETKDKIKAIKSSIPSINKDLKETESNSRTPSKAKEKTKLLERLHYKQRKLAKFQTKLAEMEDDRKNHRVRVAFGTKKLFKAQHYLKENGYQNHQEWLEDWTKARNKQFFLIGSKDESNGNQNCPIIPKEDESFDIFLTLPPFLVNQGYSKILHLKGIKFEYGRDAILAAIEANNDRKIDKSTKRALIQDPKEKRKVTSELGRALSYRFIKDHDKNKWKIHVSIDHPQPERISRSKHYGVIGVDINADHLAVTEIDRFGNPIKTKSIPCITYGRTKHQRLATIGEASKELVEWAKESRKPIVLEKLDFSKKRAELTECFSPPKV